MVYVQTEMGLDDARLVEVADGVRVLQQRIPLVARAVPGNLSKIRATQQRPQAPFARPSPPR